MGCIPAKNQPQLNRICTHNPRAMLVVPMPCCMQCTWRWSCRVAILRDNSSNNTAWTKSQAHVPKIPNHKEPKRKLWHWAYGSGQPLRAQPSLLETHTLDCTKLTLRSKKSVLWRWFSESLRKKTEGKACTLCRTRSGLWWGRQRLRRVVGIWACAHRSSVGNC